jgi:hypothetical protein
MAQKSKAATRQPSKVKVASKTSKVKKVGEAKIKASSARKTTSKVPVKPKASAMPATAPLKPASEKAGAPAAKSAAVNSKTRLDHAKAALKKEKAVAVGAKPKSRGRRISIEVSANEAASALAQKWSALFKKAEQIEAKPYNMKSVFEEKTAIVHKVLGWGYILANRNDRLEVLFKDGIKYLISNYKP